MIAKTLAKADALERIGHRLRSRISRIDARVARIQNARLLSGGLFALALLIAAMKPDWSVALPAALVFAPVFISLVVLNRRWSGFLVKLRRLHAFFARQQARLRGQAPAAPNSFAHERFGADLDFFGDFSLWTLLDETLTDEGSLELKSWITSPSLDAAGVRRRQETVRSLRSEAWFYTRLTLIADRAEMRHSSKQVLEFLARPLMGARFPLGYSVTLLIWFSWIGLFATQSRGALAAYVLFLIAHWALLGRAENQFKSGVGVSHHLSLLIPVFGALEKRTRLSAALRTLAPLTATNGPSREAKSLGFAVGFLSTSANPILHIFINAVAPWSSTGALLLERARRRLDASFAKCLAELSHLEALFSLVLFDRYQTSTYPRMTEGRMAFRQLFHPLVPRTKVVANDFAFEGETSLGLLTGSNMSGKSTFLRTVGINQALANMGAAVFAEEFSTRPLAIESCIEVSDSLRDGFSYFYAEVRRLKAVLDSAKRGSVLYLIDEIFRGTNNRERQIGSRAVIEALAASTASEGFVSTHDLELTALEGPTVVNLHFREEISPSGEMSFTYKLQRGASPTTNALRIMQLEGLPVESGGPK